MHQIAADIRAYNLTIRGIIKGYFTGHSFYAVLRYRFAHFLLKKGVKVLPTIISYGSLKKFGCEISPYAKIKGGLFIPHTIGIVIGHQVEIGYNCEIFQHVTIGSNRKKKDGRVMPIIGNNVSIGTGAIIVGPIKIGDNVIIGAMSVH